MALHRKLRGSMDMPPQYIRIPTSRTSGQGAGHSLHERQPRARRLYTQRYVASDRSRKISSLQLRACFMLCVLLYFGAIYFADDITNLGRVVGSEQNNKSFFVHSLQPRGRGNVRVGRAVDAKRVEAIAVPTKTVTTLSGRTEAEAQPTAAQRRPEQQQTDEGSKSQDKGVSQEGQMQQQLNHQAQISGMPIAKQASG
ncbi:hypothetical protein BBO99_00007555 [Phytophthora kernoviae]|uniref:Transmembrane protein n=2 Tax=Phytophthora kernoviae TaxID=325452 RepID=A0A421GHW7_9STRA|nr:hypothetical protein G195_008573 [Phytophthora kernoviae 00238/432]KAG2518185.1 hypothetical protein JM16_007385 [Phytophthora kernoviae]KAG2519993.1 hypothetical protein JM18_007118 [Phytophthora kernoviae]RLN05678.1 hypothetical protein BBI17_007495 [Phytophthora kernoviae]RLN76440.1 hypothetical protein BBO99_00007555 [Phytophthora kernoviae]